ncbi:class I SAM-dependent methyltransferase [Paenibacillus sp. GSMTC-2017]|uniref:class I SAM-dependent methyltransferase n=1 Tax=Paenibacillus sp. GSMTC-2017 TaxID=2794350 RepID=UPI0018D8DAEA|nr:class I SAM-dependent methyltransferase [Paenibacillus sp. GSMTC-2017]MBH5318881.1 class I SAM-dependent methyltransferase [Paenibacillus sp. GSMTC-2017]
MSMNGSYEGIEADTYDLWFVGDSSEESDFYETCMKEVPGPALEIGSGTGRLLLPYLQKGYDVHGVEPSKQMNDICKAKGKQIGVDPVLYDQYMQHLDLTLSYKTIYIPLASFMLVADRDEAIKALELMYLHLEEDGQVIIPLFIPREQLSSPKKEWTIRRCGEREDGATIVVNQSSDIAFNDQIQTNWNRYEIYHAGKLVESNFEVMKLRWYYRYEFEMMLERAGFRDVSLYRGYDRSPLSADQSFMIFRARK